VVPILGEAGDISKGWSLVEPTGKVFGDGFAKGGASGRLLTGVVVIEIDV